MQRAGDPNVRVICAVRRDVSERRRSRCPALFSSRPLPQAAGGPSSARCRTPCD